MNGRLEQVLEALWRRSRFVSYFYQAVQFSAEPGIPTIALSVRDARLVMYYNPAFTEQMTDDEMTGLLVHEMLHVVLNHDHRAFSAEERYLQNLAQDMVVNSFIAGAQDNFFSRKDRQDGAAPLLLPRGLPLVPRAFVKETGVADPSWEEVFRWLKGRPKRSLGELAAGDTCTPGPAPGAAASGDDGAPPDFSTLLAGEPGISAISFGGMEGLAFVDGLDRIVPTGMHVCLDRAGFADLDARKSALLGMAGRDREFAQERAFQEIRGIIERTRGLDTSSWRRLLRCLVDYSARWDEWAYTYGRFSRRHFANGVYSPGRVFRHREAITVAVDVSGSMVMTPSDIEEAFGAIEELMGKYRVHLVCLDEDLFIPEKRGDALAASRAADRPFVYRRGDWKLIRTGSGGTTFFSPLFNRYMKGHRETLVVITDGHIYDLERLKRYHPTVWVITRGRQEPFHPPFGRSVKMAAAS